jgi:hypothetical protein
MDNKNLKLLLQELDSLTGLDTVKQEIRKIIHMEETKLKRIKEGLPTSENQTLHMLFTGNPGTGKTTVARLIGKIFKTLGVLKQGTFKEAKINELIAPYVGQTTYLTQQVIDNSLDGVLFIDEAYALSRVSGYGTECIDTLVPNMENYRDRLIVIFAGYRDEMEEFTKANSGIASRIAYTIDFPDYNGEELYTIFRYFCDKKEYKYSEEVESKIWEIIDFAHRNRGEKFGNARDVRNFVEKIEREQASRIARDNLENKLDLQTFTLEDIPIWQAHTDRDDEDLTDIENFTQPPALSVPVHVIRDFYRNYTKSNIIPPLVMLSPPCIEEGGSLHIALDNDVREFIETNYSIQDLKHPVKFMGGGINEKYISTVHGEAAIEPIYSALKSVPTIVIVSQVDREAIAIFLAKWDKQKVTYNYKKAISLFYKDTTETNLQSVHFLDLITCHKILVAFSIDVYYLTNYKVYPRLPNLLPELLSLVSIQNWRRLVVEYLFENYQLLYDTETNLQVRSEFILDVVSGLSSDLVESQAKSQIENSIRFWLIIKFNEDFKLLSFRQLIDKLLLVVEVTDLSYLRKLCFCLKLIKDWDSSSHVFKVIESLSNSKITKQIARDEKGDTLYDY